MHETLEQILEQVIFILSSTRGSWLKYLLFCSYKPSSYGQIVLSHYQKDYLTYKHGIEHSSWDTIAFVSVKEKCIYISEKYSNEDATWREHLSICRKCQIGAKRDLMFKICLLKTASMAPHLRDRNTKRSSLIRQLVVSGTQVLWTELTRLSKTLQARLNQSGTGT